MIGNQMQKNSSGEARITRAKVTAFLLKPNKSLSSLLIVSLISSIFFGSAAQAYQCKPSDGVMPSKCLIFIKSSDRARGRSAVENAVLHDSVELKIFENNDPRNPQYGRGESRIFFQAHRHMPNQDACVANHALNNRCGMDSRDYRANNTSVNFDFLEVNQRVMGAFGFPSGVSYAALGLLIYMIKKMSKSPQATQELIDRSAALRGRAAVIPALRVWATRFSNWLVRINDPTSGEQNATIRAVIVWVMEFGLLSQMHSWIRSQVNRIFNYDRRADYITDLNVWLNQLNRDCPAGVANERAEFVIGSPLDSVQSLLNANPNTPAVNLLGLVTADGGIAQDASVPSVVQAPATGNNAPQARIAGCARLAFVDSLDEVTERIQAFFREHNTNTIYNIGLYRPAASNIEPESVDFQVNVEIPSSQSAQQPAVQQAPVAGNQMVPVVAPQRAAPAARR